MDLFNRGQIGKMQEAIRGEQLDGWLFCNFHHRDALADELLHIKAGAVNSRLWLYAVPAAGEPVRIVHAIEEGALAHLPGTQVSYRSREELFERLAPLGGKRWAVHISDTISAVSYLDAGTAANFEKAGLILVSAASLIQRFKGLLTVSETEAHEKAALQLGEIVGAAWAKVEEFYAAGKELYEGDIQDVMTAEMKNRNMITDHPPIVAAGKNSADPHYEIVPARGERRGKLIQENEVIQFDLWAKAADGIYADGIYADISWIGVYGTSASAAAEKAFAGLISVREGTIRFIEQEFAAGRPLTGAGVDRKAREILFDLGYAEAIRHRTGHGIDTEVHGSGVNMDAVEFPDSRLLLEGSCFSLEPGIYFSDFGMRTEIDVYIQGGRPVVSGKDRQFALLTCH
ncbi:MAG: aminopeptidase P family protein [Treponema sp.]|jgi:Xaa-Pro aminopeptidase|nr:aminopeptidase P family protein [Treponema sp.]